MIDHLKWLKPRSLPLLFSTASLFLLSLPASAAEKVYVSLGLLEISVSVDSLEKYAEDGTVTPELGAYTRYLNQQQKQRLQEVLTIPAELDTIAISQFLYSPQGEAILRQFGEIVDTKHRQGGFYAIRAGLILASAKEEELTLLTFLRHFPTEGLRINSGRGFELVNQLSRFIRETEEAVTLIKGKSQAQISLSTQDDLFLHDLESQGNVAFQTESLRLVDRERDFVRVGVRSPSQREILAELYLPETSEPPPLIMISHGLGSDRHTYAYLAENLASYGFAVATIEHPGSNVRQLESLMMGLEGEISPPEELVNRPLDIQFLLDYLEQNYSEDIDTNNVGVIGQSYGGYTSLAVAGATIDYPTVASRCDNQDKAAVLNLSLLLQCQLTRLPEEDYQFNDPRIQAVFAMNPFASKIFGEEGMANIDVPTLILAGSEDTVTPALTEQIRPFTWLDVPNQYLVLLKGGTHFSLIPPAEGDAIAIPTEAIGPDPEIAQGYVEALTTAFFKTHLAQKSEYQAYLSPNYFQQISQSLMPIFLINRLSPEELAN
ncbi:alpha/beta hydrolase [Euhalothece natronophila Z-M001]|uniref:Alpha/beta hydrolase n=1 Tax=Euhalothece natronophila Z-M001 TaxID=522448 RepID=A0A5B8NKM1_9CHRO|nr:alpha/beta hydrolase [Euhalothece natronophila]QDZ39427.1 alpha/beta hydrolase [Euhalothece natronophila Z-M001]